MKRINWKTGLLSTMAFLLVSASVAAASPLSELKKANIKLNSLAKANASDAQLKRFVNRLIDYDTMAQECLKTQWGTLTAAQKAEFKKLFKSLIEKNYIKGIRKNAKYSVDYKREHVAGRQARVYTVVHSVKRGRPRQTEVVYRMHRRGRSWAMTDMITDDVSMVRNYRKSFTRIITKHDFATLLQKMRKKLGTS